MLERIGEQAECFISCDGGSVEEERRQRDERRDGKSGPADT